MNQQSISNQIKYYVEMSTIHPDIFLSIFDKFNKIHNNLIFRLIKDNKIILKYYNEYFKKNVLEIFKYNKFVDILDIKFDISFFVNHLKNNPLNYLNLPNELKKNKLIINEISKYDKIWLDFLNKNPYYYKIIPIKLKSNINIASAVFDNNNYFILSYFKNAPTIIKTNYDIALKVFINFPIILYESPYNTNKQFILKCLILNIEVINYIYNIIYDDYDFVKDIINILYLHYNKKVLVTFILRNLNYYNLLTDENKLYLEDDLLILNYKIFPYIIKFYENNICIKNIIELIIKSLKINYLTFIYKDIMYKYIPYINKYYSNIYNLTSLKIIYIWIIVNNNFLLLTDRKISAYYKINNFIINNFKILFKKQGNNIFKNINNIWTNYDYIDNMYNIRKHKFDNLYNRFIKIKYFNNNLVNKEDLISRIIIFKKNNNQYSFHKNNIKYNYESTNIIESMFIDKFIDSINKFTFIKSIANSIKFSMHRKYTYLLYKNKKIPYEIIKHILSFMWDIDINCDKLYPFIEK